LTAAQVTVLPEPLWATVIEVNPIERQILTDQGLISVYDQARIFDLTTLIHRTADFSDIAEGDLLLLYGFTTCDPSEAPFLAHVALIMPEMTSSGEE
jgi:hypothetical protein